VIQVFVDRFMAAKPAFEAALRDGHPTGYEELVKRVVAVVGEGNEYEEDLPDVDRITVIDHGNYQGTLLFIVGAKGYQPSTYWAIYVSYGSCTGCDTFEAIKGYDDEAPTEEQVRDYWTLMLHMVQAMCRIDGESA